MLVSPDGFPGELAFGIVPAGEEGHLLERHSVGYLADPTGIVKEDGPDPAREGSVLAVGGINGYQRGEALPGASPRLAMRSRRGDTWPPLSATREEVEALRGLHEQVLAWPDPFDALEGSAATEEAVRTALPGHRYLHLATHGCFEPDELSSLMADAKKKIAQARPGEEIRAVGLHAAKLRMLRQNRADCGGDARPSTWGAFVLSGDRQ